MPPGAQLFSCPLRACVVRDVARLRRRRSAYRARAGRVVERRRAARRTAVTPTSRFRRSWSGSREAPCKGTSASRAPMRRARASSARRRAPSRGSRQSTSTTSAFARITEGRRVRFDGSPVWPNRAAIAQTDLPSVSLAYDISGAPLPDEPDGSQDSLEVWTGSHGNGTRTSSVAADRCNDWTASDEQLQGTIGQPSQPMVWSSSTKANCDSFHRLVCFEL